MAHASYAIIRDNKMVLIDPARDPQPYYDFAQLHEADITGVIETHPHADFVSSHLEIHQNYRCHNLLQQTGRRGLPA